MNLLKHYDLSKKHNILWVKTYFLKAIPRYSVLQALQKDDPSNT